MIQPLWKTGWQILRKLNMNLPYGPTSLSVSIYPQAKPSSGPNSTRLLCFCIGRGCFLQQQQSWILATETAQPTIPKIFTIWSLTEKVCQHLPREKKTLTDQKTCIQMFTATLVVIVNNWNQPKYLSFNRFMEK